MNVRPFPTVNADRAIAAIDEEIGSMNPGPRRVGPPTTLQLKRTAAKLRKLIKAEESRQAAAREVDRLQRKLDDTFRMPFDRAQDDYSNR